MAKRAAETAKKSEERPEIKRTAGTVRRSKTYVDFAAVLKKAGHSGKAYEKTNYLPTGLTLVDAITGNGFLGGRFSMLHGEEMTYKSSFSYHLGGITQQLDGAVWIDDPEDKWDADVARINGLDPDKIYYTQSKNAEEYLSCLENWIDIGRESPVPMTHFYDSLGVMGTKDQQEASKEHPMSVAKKLAYWLSTSRSLRHLTNTNVHICWLNQQRDGVDFHSYGPPKPKLPGGRAAKFKNSLRLKMSAQALGSKDKGQTGKSPIGKLVRFTAEKIPGMPDQRWCLVPYFFHYGFDDGLSCLNYLIGLGYIKKGTADGEKLKYVIDGTALFKGEWRARFYADDGVKREIRAMTRRAFLADNSYQGGEADACDEDEEE